MEVFYITYITVSLCMLEPSNFIITIASGITKIALLTIEKHTEIRWTLFFIFRPKDVEANWNTEILQNLPGILQKWSINGKGKQIDLDKLRRIWEWHEKFQMFDNP